MEVKKRAKIITDWINNYCDKTSFKPKALIGLNLEPLFSILILPGAYLTKNFGLNKCTELFDIFFCNSMLLKYPKAP